MEFDVFAAKSQALTGQLIIGFAVALHKEFVAYSALDNIFVDYFINRHKRLTVRKVQHFYSAGLAWKFCGIQANT